MKINKKYKSLLLTISVIMSNSKPGGSRKCILNWHLLQLNDKPLKFHLDGYNPYEFYSLTKIVEAHGGQLTIPDKETIIFAERDRPVQKYYYRYDIKFVHDCIVENKMQDIHRYLLPTTTDRPINSGASDPVNGRQQNEEIHHRTIDSSKKIHEKFSTIDVNSPTSYPSLISSSGDDSHYKSLNVGKKSNSLPLKRVIDDMPTLIPHIFNSLMEKSAREDAVIYISDDDLQPPKLDQSAIVNVNRGIHNDAKRSKIEYLSVGEFPNDTCDVDGGRGNSLSSRYSASSGNNLNHKGISRRMNASPKRTARKSTTKNGEQVVSRRD